MDSDASAGRPGLPVSISRRAQRHSRLLSPSSPAARPAPGISSQRCQHAWRAGEPGGFGARGHGGPCGQLWRRMGVAGCGSRRLGRGVYYCCVMRSPSAPAHWQPWKRRVGGEEKHRAGPLACRRSDVAFARCRAARQLRRGNCCWLWCSDWPCSRPGATAPQLGREQPGSGCCRAG